MSAYNTVSTDNWQINLPEDWSQQRSDAPNKLYFEAKDGTKAAYITVFALTDSKSSGLAILAGWREKEINGLYGMPDYKWEIVEEWQHDETGVATSGSDCFASARCYRIVCLRMTRFPWLVRVSLHDYECRDYVLSKNYFQTIVESLSPATNSGDTQKVVTRVSVTPRIT